ncbi:MAG: hypothetical protein OWQ48_06415 [Desulfurococcus sp.]|nr:hypothetical protein [Desulfurococcus sp.]
MMLNLQSIDWWGILVDIAIAVLIAVVGVNGGWIARWLINYLLGKIGINDWFRRFNIGRAIMRSGYAPSELFGLIGSWVIYLLGFLYAILYLTQYPSLQPLREPISLVISFIYGFVKAFIIIIIGDILVDTFIGYIYKSESTSQLASLVPAAEYLRIIFYIVVMVYALQLGGLPVEILWGLITPVIWGLTIIVVVLVASEAVRRVRTQ